MLPTGSGKKALALTKRQAQPKFLIDAIGGPWKLRHPTLTLTANLNLTRQE